jgi:predicted dehydrogenase
MKGKVRLGIVGCGAIAEGAHLPAALTSDAVELTALVDSSEARLRQLKRRYGLECLMTTDVREIKPEVDAVVLALPNALHSSIGADFLSQGIHVLCEKPLARTVAECNVMCAAAQAASAILAVGYMTRFYPSTRLTKELLDTDFLGKIHSFDYQFGTEGGWAPLSGYNLKRETSGGGVLVVSGSHFIDRMLYLFGNVQIVRYQDDSMGGIEANCCIDLVASLNGQACQGRITLSKTHRLANRLAIVGERGTLTVREGQSESVTYIPDSGTLSHEIGYNRAAGSTPDTDYYRAQLEDFVRAIRDNVQPCVNGEQGTASVRLIEECYASARLIDEIWSRATLDRLISLIPA